MAQGDILANFINNPLARANSSGRISDAETLSIKKQLLSNEIAIYNRKKEIYKLDLKEKGLLGGMADIGKKWVKSTKDLRDYKKAQISDEKILTDITKKIYALRSKGDRESAKMMLEMAKSKKLQMAMDRVQQNQVLRSIPILGRMGAFGERTAEAVAATSESFGVISAILGPIVKGIFAAGAAVVGILLAPLTKSFETFLKIQSTVGNLSADIGLSKSESAQLLNNFASLTIQASMFGGTMEDVSKIIQTFSETTGRNRVFDKEEIGKLTELGLATGLGVQGAAEMIGKFDNLGVSITSALKLTDKARASAVKLGLNTTDVLKNYNALVTNLSGYQFKNGLEGLVKLAATATSLKIDLAQTASNLSNKLFDLEGAVEAAARLQTLGGKFAEQFGDPFDLMFQAQNDPGKLAEKMVASIQTKMKRGADGSMIISPMDRKIIMEAADALGESGDVWVKGAIKAADLADKMQQLNKNGGLMGMSDENQKALANLVKINEKGEYVIKNSAGVDTLLSAMTDRTQLEALLATRELNDKAAIQRKNISDRFGLIVDRFLLGTSQVFVRLNGILENNNFMNSVEAFGKNIAEKLIPFIDKIFNPNGGVYKFFDSLTKTLTEIMSKVQKVFDANGGDIWKSIKEGFSLLVKSIWDEVMPYIKEAMGTIFIAMEDIPIIGKSMASAGYKMQIDAAMKNKDIYDINGGKNGVNNKIGKRNSDSGSLMGGIIGGGVGGALGALLLGILAAPATGGLSLALATAGGVALGSTIGYNAMGDKNIEPVQDALITPSGNVLKGSKGDIGILMDQAGMSRGLGNGVSEIKHSGTITIRSDDGKEITLRDLDRIGRQTLATYMSSAQDNNDKGFGLNSSMNRMPISPL